MTKRERTRRAIRASALELFRARGFDDVTVADVARRAGVTEMTVYRHFATKAALVIDDPYDPLIADAVAARPAEEPAIVAVARGVKDAWRAVPEPDASAVRETLQLVASHPALRSSLDTGTRATEAAIIAALAARGVVASAAAVVAAAVVAGLNAALLAWAVEPVERPLDDAIVGALGALIGGEA
ncbi:hypothetical protein GCM10009808_20250 [Microbacterium sediminicola]|uniref:HTH tetR-type domain-containing protein n=1 Tax=Microbacterium sediminicola TaxID=415210 RepID=A0ABP4UEF8_9MICO